MTIVPKEAHPVMIIRILREMGCIIVDIFRICRSIIKIRIVNYISKIDTTKLSDNVIH